MKPPIQNSRFDENETDSLIANYGTKLSPETWQDLQSILNGERENFLTQERQRQNSRQRPGRRM